METRLRLPRVCRHVSFSWSQMLSTSAVLLVVVLVSALVRALWVRWATMQPLMVAAFQVAGVVARRQLAQTAIYANARVVHFIEN